jgi:hypothetical protein
MNTLAGLLLPCRTTLVNATANLTIDRVHSVGFARRRRSVIVNVGGGMRDVALLA